MPVPSRHDARARRTHRKIAKALRANRIAEAQYSKVVVDVLRGVHRGILGLVERDVLPALVARHDDVSTCPRVHADAKDETPAERAKRILTPRLRKKVAGHVRDRAGPAYDTMAGQVDKKNRAAMLLIGIPVRDAAAGVLGKVAEMRENNLRLIEDAGGDFYDDVRDVLAESEGLRVEEIADLLDGVAGISARRARLISVDQTLKLSSALTQARQVAAGVETYKWSTSMDERVRGNPGGLYPKADPSHWDLEGQEFSWSDPPLAGTSGEPAHPGQAINCRCVPVPVIAGLDEQPEGETSESDVPFEPEDLDVAAQ